MRFVRTFNRLDFTTSSPTKIHWPQRIRPKRPAALGFVSWLGDSVYVSVSNRCASVVKTTLKSVQDAACTRSLTVISSSVQCARCGSSPSCSFEVKRDEFMVRGLKVSNKRSVSPYRQSISNKIVQRFKPVVHPILSNHQCAYT
ncbi:hypothetical protein Mapa_016653 [Marchantia paleacea]|nr:hypothetical protein Mapa_016653 [Marchantia paleacea]